MYIKINDESLSKQMVYTRINKKVLYQCWNHNMKQQTIFDSSKETCSKEKMILLCVGKLGSSNWTLRVKFVYVCLSKLSDDHLAGDNAV